MKKIVCWFGMLVALTGTSSSEDEKPILTESSVWRSRVTWMRAVVKKDTGIEVLRMYGGLKEDVEPPPGAWIQPDYDDSDWSYWREPCRVETLKLKQQGSRLVWSRDGNDTGVRVFGPGQYGERRTPHIGLCCLRGRFVVEDAGKAGKLSLAVEFRGGIAVYLNGREVGRAYLPKEGPIEPATLADHYPQDAFISWDTEKKTEKAKKAEWIAGIPMDPELLSRYNARIRRLDVEIPGGALRTGVNTLAVEIHRAPHNPPGGEKEDWSWAWSKCGMVSLRLSGRGAVLPAVGRPEGLHVWNANPLSRITPFGFAYTTRIGAGGVVIYERYPLTWGDRNAPIAPVRLTGARNGLCVGQMGISCDTPLTGLKATVGDLVQIGGSGRIPASHAQALYMVFPDKPCRGTDSEAASFIDALNVAPPDNVPLRAEETGSWLELGSSHNSAGVTTWIDGGAALAVWIRVTVPRDAAAGNYAGILTMSTARHPPVAVPVRLRVADWTIPDPSDYASFVDVLHSADTLARWYRVPMWSDRHWALMEQTVARMGELGARVVYLPLKADTMLFCNEQTWVYWVKQADLSRRSGAAGDAKADGRFAYDYRVFDRYLDLIHKHLKPKVYCLYAVDFSPRSGPGRYSLLDPGTGKVELSQGLENAATPEAVAFWKPVFDSAVERLEKRGVKQDSIMLGMTWEGTMSGKTGGTGEFASPTQLFRDVIPPWMKLVQWAHVGGGRGAIPYGYVTSVYGNTMDRSGADVYGAPSMSLRMVNFHRGDPVMDMRPMSHRGAMHLAMERAMQGTRGNSRRSQGLGAVGMDFWYLPADSERKWRGGYLISNRTGSLNMSSQGTSALLAPGSEGPVLTARFDVYKTGLQESEARVILERALGDKDARSRLDETLVKRCEQVIAERDKIYGLVTAGGGAYGDGWPWYECSGWEDRAYDIFTCAGEVQKSLNLKE